VPVDAATIGIVSAVLIDPITVSVRIYKTAIGDLVRARFDFDLAHRSVLLMKNNYHARSFFGGRGFIVPPQP
jgi:hypothetical protein